MPDRPPTIALRNVTVARGGRVVLDIAEFDVRDGEVLAIVGPNGAGKSTLLELLGLARRPASGRVIAFGRDLGAGPAPLELRRRIALTVQSTVLFRGTVAENVAVGLRLRDLRNDEICSRVDAALARFGISGLKHRRAQALSGGEARRVVLARAIALRPDLLLLDEPFAALDPSTRAGLVADARAVFREAAGAVAFVTHDRDEALVLADRIVVLDRGRIVQVGRPAEIVAMPSHPTVGEIFAGQSPADARIIGAGPDYVAIAVGGRIIRVDLDARRSRRAEQGE